MSFATAALAHTKMLASRPVCLDGAMELRRSAVEWGGGMSTCFTAGPVVSGFVV